MADQLAGHWYLRASGCTEQVFPDGNVKRALQMIYDNNVLRFAGGKLGAVNGYVVGAGGATGAVGAGGAAGGHVDTTALQSEEAWTGVTCGLAALMIYEGK
ncbi:PREDICTED: non-lysosomal glucosylceramidase-like [Papilio polytes]|uniref:non-lysosomal glucosylceramidase-like n=1 Tax=Papilio polytes TaxID=76194 RepID=UPI000675EB15|nr:PREDICTED: non-lysosomal glucosylceramidase-like [Papilio polytes]